MFSVIRKDLCTILMLAVAVALVPGSRSLAQSTSKNRSTSRSASRATVALEGYCAVCIIDMKQWVQGSNEHQAQYDGKAYFFPSEQIRQKFLSQPSRYVPALGGDCIVCYAGAGKRVPGNIRHAAFFRNRLFLFPSDQEKSVFVADPQSYDNADLALNGECAVCLAEMGERVQGSADFTAYHHGLRYLFPGRKQRDLFLANPTKYVSVAPSSQAQLANASVDLVSAQGRSGCAACEHGVHPLGAADTLGLAVNSRDGTIYVVEDAHRLYPKIYEARFDGLALEVSGKVVKQDGEFVWIQPRDLRVVN